MILPYVLSHPNWFFSDIWFLENKNFILGILIQISQTGSESAIYVSNNIFSYAPRDIVQRQDAM